MDSITFKENHTSLNIPTSISNIWTMISFYDSETLRNILYNKFIERMNEIKYMPEIIQELKRINEIQGQKAIITGSTLLKVLLNEKWDSDIDIFVNKNTDFNIELPGLVLHNSNDKNYKNKYNRLDIKKINKYVDQNDTTKKIIEIVKMDTESCEPNNIIYGFDLSGVKCWFDGTTLYINKPNETFKKIMFMDSKFHSESRNQKRIEKYEKRGFKIIVSV